MSELHRITIDPEQCGGRPCVRGLRVRVSDILNLLASGATREEILTDYPYLEAGDMTAALEYAARQNDHPVLSVASKPESHPNHDNSADWHGFFRSVPPVPEDFMAERASQEQPASESS